MTRWDIITRLSGIERPRDPIGGGRHKDRGFALLTVLLGLSVATVLLSASMTRTISSVKIHRLSVAEAAEAARLEGAVLLHLVANAAQPPVIDGVTVRLEIRDVRGLVDVNTAAPEVLLGLLRGIGHPDPETQSEAIVEARHRLRPWSTPQELLRLKLLDRASFQKLRGYLTILSGLAVPESGVTSDPLKDLLFDGGYALPEATTPSPGGGILQITSSTSDRAYAYRIARPGSPPVLIWSK